MSVSVFEGNTGDPKTLLPQVEKVRKGFGLDRLVLAGDRGMISNIQVEALRQLDGVDWITALKSGAIARLAEGGHLQLDLFDERNLISFTHADYPGERLIEGLLLLRRGAGGEGEGGLAGARAAGPHRVADDGGQMREQAREAHRGRPVGQRARVHLGERRLRAPSRADGVGEACGIRVGLVLEGERLRHGEAMLRMDASIMCHCT